MLNINRKYLCKKTYFGCIEGQYYAVGDMSYFNTVDMIVCDGELCHNESFSLELLIPNYYSHTNAIFYDYFYTEQEERQLKLKRLNNVKY